jgi:hypothetical protein
MTGILAVVFASLGLGSWFVGDEWSEGEEETR